MGLEENPKKRKYHTAIEQRPTDQHIEEMENAETYVGGLEDETYTDPAIYGQENMQKKRNTFIHANMRNKYLYGPGKYEWKELRKI